jgi:hypothetical protein
VITVRPDPTHPLGGYAELSLPEGNVSGETTEVAVYDNYSERYLGESGWQATKVLFGPYEVRRDGGQARLIIGPEIVNQIEEYANVKVTVGTAEADIAWPDEVVPAPGAAKIGGIMGTKTKSAAPKSALTAKISEPESDPVPVEPEPEPGTQVDESAAVEDEKKAGGTAGMLLGLLAMVLLAAGLAYWFLYSDGVPPAGQTAVPEEPIVAPAPVAEASDPCSADELGTLPDFTAQASALRECAGRASADAALGLVERAAAANDAGALMLFGMVYDGAASDAVIEDQIGLTFGDVPATAAEYYARAVSAGSEEAAEKLGALCERMAGLTDTLAKSAVSDYCGN